MYRPQVELADIAFFTQVMFEYDGALTNISHTSLDFVYPQIQNASPPDEFNNTSIYSPDGGLNMPTSEYVAFGLPIQMVYDRDIYKYATKGQMWITGNTTDISITAFLSMSTASPSLSRVTKTNQSRIWKMLPTKVDRNTSGIVASVEQQIELIAFQGSNNTIYAGFLVYNHGSQTVVKFKYDQYIQRYIQDIDDFDPNR